MLDSDCRHKPSPMRLLEILSDRFGAFEAVANSTIKLARVAPENVSSMPNGSLAPPELSRTTPTSRPALTRRTRNSASALDSR